MDKHIPLKSQANFSLSGKLQALETYFSNNIECFELIRRCSKTINFAELTLDELQKGKMPTFREQDRTYLFSKHLQQDLDVCKDILVRAGQDELSHYVNDVQKRIVDLGYDWLEENTKRFAQPFITTPIPGSLPPAFPY